jgi:hypothetical protein
MTEDAPAFPLTEVSRHITQPGMTTREYAVIHYVAALIQAHPSMDYARVVQNARELADLTLADEG